MGPVSTRIRSLIVLPLLFVLTACDGTSPVIPIDDPVGPIDFEPAWSPDSQSVLYTHVPQTSEEMALGHPQVWRLDLASGVREFVTAGRSAAWSPDGDSIVVVDGDRLCTLDLATKTKRLIGPEAFSIQPAWSSSGWIAYSTNYGDPRGSSTIALVRPDGSDWRDISQHGTGEWKDPSWSPDGEWLVHFRYVGVGGSEVFVMDSAGARSRRLTNDSSDDRDSAWSPDGQWILWATYGTGGGLYLMRPDGTERRFLLRAGFDPTWSPDGSRIAFSYWAPDGKPATIWSIKPDGSELTRLTSPD